MFLGGHPGLVKLVVLADDVHRALDVASHQGSKFHPPPEVLHQYGLSESDFHIDRAPISRACLAAGFGEEQVVHPSSQDETPKGYQGTPKGCEPPRERDTPKDDNGITSGEPSGLGIQGVEGSVDGDAVTLFTSKEFSLLLGITNLGISRLPTFKINLGLCSSNVHQMMTG